MKKLIGFLSSLLITAQSSAIVASCGCQTKTTSEEDANKNPNLDTFKIDDQYIYENSGKIIVARIPEAIKDAEIKVTDYDKNNLYVHTSIDKDSEQLGYFEIRILAKKVSESTLKVKYGESETTFKVNVVDSKHDDPKVELEKEQKIAVNQTAPIKAVILNPVKDAKFSIDSIDRSVAQVINTTGVDSEGKGLIEFNIKGLREGETRVLVNYGNAQGVLILKVVKQSESKVPLIHTYDVDMQKNQTIDRDFLVENAVKGSKISMVSSKNDVKVTLKNTMDDSGDGVILFDVTSPDKVIDDCEITVIYGESVGKFKVNVLDAPKFTTSPKSPITINEGMHSNNNEFKVENHYQYAPIKVEVSDNDKKYIDAFSMSDYDMENTGTFILVVYGLEPTSSEGCIVNVSYGDTSIKIKVIVNKVEKPAPSIFGLSEDSVYELKTSQGLAVLSYINNPISEGILTTTFENNDNLDVEITGHKGSDHYNIFLISGSKPSEEQEVTFQYSGAKDVKIKVKVTSR
ncbi:hypothetical protein SHELI_v1c01130 [Spiroplasma helicoides]|uniref:Uncharacterized protein n=1 Tax=Spiroplasma helicoides TaxID=216938 RepID=A0A1B3SJG5_9MOLU|nr:hypothetical protein [Spiroplasma helicoides]AOG60068.1 hypothetical protein SHELI_v1c01130 [Spiroplasma helicoides]